MVGEGAMNLPRGTERGAGSVVKLTLELAALAVEMTGLGVPSRRCGCPGLGHRASVVLTAPTVGGRVFMLHGSTRGQRLGGLLGDGVGVGSSQGSL